MLEIILIILVGGGIVAVICFAAQIYHWYLDSKYAKPIIREKNIELDKANKKIKELEKLRLEIAKLQSQIDERDKNIEKLIDEREYWREKHSEICREYREKCEIINSGNYEASQQLAVLMAQQMAQQHRICEYYSEDNIKTFRKYFKSVAFDKYIEDVILHKFVKAVDEDIEITTGIEVTTYVKSASNEKMFYKVSLDSCDCPDCQSRKKPCKHMLFLAMKVGTLMYNKEERDNIYTAIYNNLKQIDEEKK